LACASRKLWNKAFKRQCWRDKNRGGGGGGGQKWRGGKGKLAWRGGGQVVDSLKSKVVGTERREYDAHSVKSEK